MSNIYIKWIIRLVVGVLIFFLLFKYVEYSENEKILKEISEKNERQEKAIQGLYSTKLFGIQLGQRADFLLLKLKNLEINIENRFKVLEETGLLKETERKNAWVGFYYSINLSAYENNILIKNEDFSDYYIGYHPGNYEIYTIAGKLKKLYNGKDECVQNLKPYANILLDKIINNNSNERIVIEDKFYPSEIFPNISLSYKSDFDEKNIIILTIRGHCTGKVSLLSLNAPLIKPQRLNIMLMDEKIKNKKKLEKKDNFDEEIREKEKSIDTQGL